MLSSSSRIGLLVATAGTVPSKASNLLRNQWWVTAYGNSVSRIMAAMETLYQRADRFSVGGWSGSSILHTAFVNCFLLLPYAVSSHYRSHVRELLLGVLSLGTVGSLKFGDSISDSGKGYFIGHIIYLLTLWCPRPARPAVIVSVAVLGGLSLGLFDWQTLLLLCSFILFVYGLLSLAAEPRLWRLLGGLVAYLLFLNVCPQLETPGSNFFSIGIIPMLCYAVYDRSAKGSSYAAFNAYFMCRLFTAPVFPMRDLQLAKADLRHCQLRGLFALAVAIVSMSLCTGLNQYLSGVNFMGPRATGVRLGFYSYIYYLAFCFYLVTHFYLFVGWLRLLGIPMKSPFGFWLLARTPNERWRKWNILFREWILTYVFYPMMRARTGLFAAIMVTLLTSGAIHLVRLMTADRWNSVHATRTMIYWFINGLAIYVVISFTQRFPALIARFRMAESVVWSVFGIAFTSGFYSLLICMRDKCESIQDVLDFLSRLVCA